jgi:hypothetical protein
MDHPASDLITTSFDEADVLETVETLLTSENRPWERMGDEVHFAATGQWCNLHGIASLQAEAPSLTVQLLFELKAPPQRRADVEALVGLMNEACWLGHFELGGDDVPVSWRFTLPLIARADPEPAEIAAILGAGVDACGKLYPAFNFLLWAGKSPQEAAEAALFETAGQA